jgi:hypothetical protein
VGSKVFGSLAIPFIVLSTGPDVGSTNKLVEVLDFMIGENPYDAATKLANKIAENFMAKDVR